MKIKYQSGFSLVEVMFAILILSILVLGSSAILYQAGGTIAIQNNKRAATSVASRRLERLGGMLYEDLRSNFGGEYYIELDNDRVSLAPDESVLVNGKLRSIVVKAETIFQSSPDREFVRVEARVQYRSGDNWLALTTHIR